MSKDHIEDIYPLSPMQQGMLFHSLLSPEAGMYLSQLNCAFSGLNADAFAHAWQQLTERHSIFRTAFVWEGFDEPIQVVFRRVSLPTERLDWGELSAGEQQQRLEAYLLAERVKGFNYSQAPLMRIALIRLGDDAHQFVWTYHHMLMDAWSESLIMKDVMAYYWASCDGRPLTLEPPRPFGDYIAWLAKQDAAETERFWRRTLEGLTAPARVGSRRQAEPSGERPSEHSEQQIRLSEAATAELQTRARRSRLTLNTFIQGAWALTLGHYSDARDVVFGVNVSGRPASLPGVESIVGIFINTLPFRVKLPQGIALSTWLKQLQDQQAELRQYEHSSLAHVQTWSEVPRGQPLFESIVVFQNATVAAAARGERPGGEQLRVNNVRSRGGWTNYPLALDAKPAAEMVLNLSYDRARFDDEDAAQMLKALETLLIAFVQRPEAELDQLLELLANLDRRQQAERARELESASIQRLKTARRRSVLAVA